MTESSPGSAALAGVGTYTIVPSAATFAAGLGSNYTIAYANGTLTVNPATPTITWANPADITSGTPLGPAQLDATGLGARHLHLHAGRGHGLALGRGAGPLGELHPDRRDRLRLRRGLDHDQRPHTAHTATSFDNRPGVVQEGPDLVHRQLQRAAEFRLGGQFWPLSGLRGRDEDREEA